MTGIRKKNKLIISTPLNFNKIINSASSSKEDLLYLCDKLNIEPYPTITWLKDYDKSMDKDGAIINLGNPLFRGGSHWVCVYKNTYFDSFGLYPPPEVKNKIYQDIKIQNPEDGKCGLYCVLFIYFAKKNNIEEFYEIFDN